MPTLPSQPQPGDNLKTRTLLCKCVFMSVRKGAGKHTAGKDLENRHINTIKMSIQERILKHPAIQARSAHQPSLFILWQKIPR